MTAVSYSPDGVLLASGDRAGGLWVWESKTNREFYNFAGHKAAITSVACAADSNIMLSASEDGTIKAWDMNNGKEAKSWQAHGGGVLSIHSRWTAESSLAAAITWSGSGSPMAR